jgi:GNAT superfamily N-acetyltransferase
LREFNLATNPQFMELRQLPKHAARPLIITASEGQEIVGGLIGETQLAWLKISIMAVAPERRRQGVGAALSAEAERHAVERGCRRAYVDTMDYQAPQFYLAHGYELTGRLDDWDSHGHAKLFFVKCLTAQR